MKRRFTKQPVISSQASEVHVSAKYEDRFSGEVNEISAKDVTELGALLELVEHMNTYVNVDDYLDEEGNPIGSVDSLIDTLASGNGDGADYIYQIKNLSTGRVYLEAEWSPDDDTELQSDSFHDDGDEFWEFDDLEVDDSRLERWRQVFSR